MRIASAFLALLVAMPPPLFAADAEVETSTSSAAILLSTGTFTGPVTVTAPRVTEQDVLKTARVAGAGTAVAGGGLMTYAVLFTAGGPFGWAAALVFLGGMTAYLSHRRLQGKEDFKWGVAPQPAPQAPATAQP
ncbi:MAG: hypothetical protein Q8T11_15925 [Elusimicrobiota bacterium]|nr:hypothetical protein [Elusimicrobiota bacterium]